MAAWLLVLLSAGAALTMAFWLSWTYRHMRQEDAGISSAMTSIASTEEADDSRGRPIQLARF